MPEEKLFTIMPEWKVYRMISQSNHGASKPMPLEQSPLSRVTYGQVYTPSINAILIWLDASTWEMESETTTFHSWYEFFYKELYRNSVILIEDNENQL
jgi:hypothetical protein